jgi:hypothetical protein
MGRLADEIYVVGKARDLMQVPTASLYQLVNYCYQQSVQVLPYRRASALSSSKSSIVRDVVWRERGDFGELDW